MEVNWGKPPESPKLVIPCEKHGPVTAVACGECMRELHDRLYDAEALAKKRESASIAAHAMLVERNSYEGIKSELATMVEYERQRAERHGETLTEVRKYLMHGNRDGAMRAIDALRASEEKRNHE